MAENKAAWGGKRAGAGRPKGSTGHARKRRSTSAHDDEWELIKRFEQLVKYGNKEACIKALKKLEGQ